MQTELQQAEAILAERRISVARLCRRADLAESTWQRLKSGSTDGARKGTREKIAAAFRELTGQDWPAAQSEAA